MLGIARISSSSCTEEDESNHGLLLTNLTVKNPGIEMAFLYLLYLHERFKARDDLHGDSALMVMSNCIVAGMRHICTWHLDCLIDELFHF